MNYISTRGGAQGCSGARAILTGMAPDGGLYVPDKLEPMDFEAMAGLAYEEIAARVVGHFLPDYPEDFLREAIAESYGENFGGMAGHLAALDEDLFALELWHGPTAAFKDYALQLMPKLLVKARELLGEQDETMILVATSGDTGKAALEGYKDLPGVSIAVFYPSEGTSEIQRLQMATQEGNNVAVYAIRGNFDDAQRGVKRAFTDAALAKELALRNVKLSSANSINWGRLLPQIVYYVSSYLQLCQYEVVAYGEKVDFCVPTGNFGDIIAGWYARALGLPVGRLIIASNKNRVLADFLATGRYEARRDFYKTSSPSMDILVSSNLERLLYHACGDGAQVAAWMEELAAKGSYQVPEALMEKIRECFAAGWADEDEVGEEILAIHDDYGYLCDPHTAVAFRVLEKASVGLYGAEDAPVAVVLSTASPFKFSGKVLASLGEAVPEDEFAAMDKLQRISGEDPPESLAAIRGKEIRFTEIIDEGAIVSIPLRFAENKGK